MKVPTFFFALLGCVTIAFGSGLPREHDTDSIAVDTNIPGVPHPLVICTDRNFGGACFWGEYKSCYSPTGKVMSLKVERGYQCIFFPYEDCRTGSGPPHYEGSKSGDIKVLDVRYKIRSHYCRPAPVHRDLDDGVLSGTIDLTATCREGEVKCAGGSLRSAVVKCEKGAWKGVKVCSDKEKCVNDPSPHCAPGRALNSRDDAAATQDAAPVGNVDEVKDEVNAP